MTRDTRQAFTLSIAVHVLAVAVGFLFGLVNLLQAEEEEPVVFTLVSAGMPAEPAPETAVEEPPSEPRPEPEAVPEMMLPEFEDLRPAPDVTLPPPPPEPAPQPEPTPEPRPQPEPEPAPEPKPQRVSYEEWARNRDLPDRVQQTRPQQRRQVDVPELHTEIRQTLRSHVRAIETSDLQFDSPGERDEVQSYFAALVSRLKAVFEPLGANRTARVEFTIERNGRITNVRFLRRSGDSGFDESVRQAFNRVRSPGPPPGSPPYTRTITFTSEDR